MPQKLLCREIGHIAADLFFLKALHQVFGYNQFGRKPLPLNGFPLFSLSENRGIW